MISVNVLLIEDDEGSINITKELLSRSEQIDFFVDSAKTLSDAIEILKCNNIYDIIILDLILPNGEGLSVFQQVKKVCDKPIIIISGYEDKAIECVKHGAQDYLVKPHYDGNLLIRSIRYALERHKWKSSFNKVVESTHAAIYEIDFETMRFTYINDVALKETGYTKEEILSMTPADILTEESIIRWLDRLEKIQCGDEIDNIEEF
jgi:DNA-binding response OmpR family regulator